MVGQRLSEVKEGYSSPENVLKKYIVGGLTSGQHICCGSAQLHQWKIGAGGSVAWDDTQKTKYSLIAI